MENWRKARRSIGNGACAEVAGDSAAVAVRDSLDPVRELRFSRDAWMSFLQHLKK